MTIDISNLNQEKRAFLKAHPDFLKSLEETLQRQARNIHVKRKKLEKTRSNHQRQMEELEKKLRCDRILDPALREINEKYTRKFEPLTTASDLICPVCGKGEDEMMHGNKGPGGKPWCLRCDAPLFPKRKLERWKKMAKIRVLPKSSKDLKKLYPGWYPEEEEK